jgi:hypothetical protein
MRAEREASSRISEARRADSRLERARSSSLFQPAGVETRASLCVCRVAKVGGRPFRSALKSGRGAPQPSSARAGVGFAGQRSCTVGCRCNALFKR